MLTTCVDSLKLMMYHYPFSIRDSIPRHDSEVTDVVKRFDQFCYYAGPERELYVGTIVLDCYQVIESADNLTVKNLRLASILAWVFENITTGCIVGDDLLDGHGVRWNKPCWHKTLPANQTSFLDIKKIQTGAKLLLCKYFRNHPNFPQLLNLICEFVHCIHLGQTVDFNLSEAFRKTRDGDLLKMENYKTLVMYKTGFPLYVAAPLGAMYLANFDTHRYFPSKHIFEKLYIYRQAQNDMWDCFCAHKDVGKTPSDVVNGKTTWISGTVLLEANRRQLKKFLENYGREDIESQRIVFEIFDELDIVGLFRKFRRDLMWECDEHASSVAHPAVAKMIHVLVEKYVNVYEDYEL
uniref:Farnesyl pyrophosphate synthase n=2 Tax=Photinus pyralis TaxID=7054 RepID=A0A1Y1KX19_PHOPY